LLRTFGTIQTLKGTLPDGRVSAKGGVVKDAKIVLGGIAPSPIQVNEAAQALIGQSLNEDQIQAAAEAAYVKARPLDNTDFVYQWRKQMARPVHLAGVARIIIVKMAATRAAPSGGTQLFERTLCLRGFVVIFAA